ncbi:MAG: peptidylprolyl isomerase [Myxococcota bacterium]
MRAIDKIVPLLLALLILLFVACHGEPSSEKRGEVILAKVDGARITLSEFSRRWRQVSSQGDPESLPIADREKLKKQLLERIIDETVLLNQARILNITPSEEEVGITLEIMKSGYPHKTRFNEEVGKAALTPITLREQVVRHTMITKLLNSEVHKRLIVTDKEIRDYYESNLKEFETPEQVTAMLITVSTEEEANMIYEKLKKGAAFQEMARQYSISPEAKEDGYLGKFPRGVMPPIFDEVCFNLAPKTFSKPTASDFGFHIFYVIEKFPKTQQSLEEVRKKIESNLMSKKASDAEKEYLNSLKQKAVIERFLENLKSIE